MIYAQIRARLSLHPTIAQEVAERIYRLRAPQGTRRPFIRVAQVSRESIDALDGATGESRARYQVDIFADDVEQTARLAAAVRAQLSGFVSSNLASSLILELDTIEEQGGSGSGLARVQQDYEFIGNFDAE